MTKNSVLRRFRPIAPLLSMIMLLACGPSMSNVPEPEPEPAPPPPVLSQAGVVASSPTTLSRLDETGEEVWTIEFHSIDHVVQLDREQAIVVGTRAKGDPTLVALFAQGSDPLWTRPFPYRGWAIFPAEGDALVEWSLNEERILVAAVVDRRSGETRHKSVAWRFHQAEVFYHVDKMIQLHGTPTLVVGSANELRFVDGVTAEVIGKLSRRHAGDFLSAMSDGALITGTEDGILQRFTPTAQLQWTRSVPGGLAKLEALSAGGVRASSDAGIRVAYDAEGVMHHNAFRLHGADAPLRFLGRFERFHDVPSFAALQSDDGSVWSATNDAPYHFDGTSWHRGITGKTTLGGVPTDWSLGWDTLHCSEIEMYKGRALMLNDAVIAEYRSVQQYVFDGKLAHYESDFLGQLWSLMEVDGAPMVCKTSGKTTACEAWDNANRAGLVFPGVFSVIEPIGNSIWAVGTRDERAVFGSFAGGTWTDRTPTNETIIKDLATVVSLDGSADDLWLGTGPSNEGVCWNCRGSHCPEGSSDGWVLLHRRGTEWDTIPSPIGAVVDIQVNATNDVWFTGPGGLAHFDGRSVARVVGAPDGIDFMMNGRGVGGASGLYRFYPQSGEIVDSDTPLPQWNDVKPITIDVQPQPTSRLERTVLEVFAADDEGGDAIASLTFAYEVAVASDGTLWFHDHELLIERSPSWNRVLADIDELPCTKCLAPVRVGVGALLTSDGLSRIEGNSPQSDGFLSHEMSAISFASDGTAWVASQDLESGLPLLVASRKHSVSYERGLPLVAYADIDARHTGTVWLAGASTAASGKLGGLGAMVRRHGSETDDLRVDSGPMRAIHAKSADEAWAVGDDGALVHIDGRETTRYRLNSGVTLRDVWHSGDDLWAVGDRSTVVHFDGQQWRQLDASAVGPNSALTGVAGGTDGTVWVVGPTGIFNVSQ